MSTKLGILYFLILAIIGINSSRADSISGCDTVVKRDSYWLVYRKDEFIIEYALAGKHILQSLPTNEDDTPDAVKDAMLQLAAMRDMLRSLGFRHPLESERYQSQGATHILVRFQALKNLTGRAFDEVRRLPTGECVLILHISSNYRSGNLTPAHEYFHLVQYGYTMFKRPWFLEGSARWAETILGEQKIRALSSPATEQDRQALFQKSYRAASTWYGLIELCDDDESTVSIPGHLADLRYSTGARVIQDNRVPGHGFIKRVLDALDALDNRVSIDEDLPEHQWPERFQRDASHDNDMWSAVTGVCRAPLCDATAPMSPSADRLDHDERFSRQRTQTP